MRSDAVLIPVGEGRKVSGILSVPDREVKRGVILAHGAGNDMNHPMIVFLAEGLAQNGYFTLRFNFLYREQGRNVPDRQETLYQTWEGAWRFLRNSPGTLRSTSSQRENPWAEESHHKWSLTAGFLSNN